MDDLIALAAIIFYLLPPQFHEPVVLAVKSGVMGIQIVPDDVVAHDINGPIFLYFRRQVSHQGSSTFSCVISGFIGKDGSIGERVSDFMGKSKDLIFHPGLRHDMRPGDSRRFIHSL
jgi:hypothetical protein